MLEFQRAGQPLLERMSKTCHETRSQGQHLPWCPDRPVPYPGPGRGRRARRVAMMSIMAQ